MASSSSVHTLPFELKRAPGGTGFDWRYPVRGKVVQEKPCHRAAACQPPTWLWPHQPWPPILATIGPLHMQLLLGSLPDHPSPPFRHRPQVSGQVSLCVGRPPRLLGGSGLSTHPQLAYRSPSYGQPGWDFWGRGRLCELMRGHSKRGQVTNQ